jgi:hypothetical protein
MFVMSQHALSITIIHDSTSAQSNGTLNKEKCHKKGWPRKTTIIFCRTKPSFNGGGRKDELRPGSKHFVRKQSEQYPNYLFTF